MIKKRFIILYVIIAVVLVSAITVLSILLLNKSKPVQTLKPITVYEWLGFINNTVYQTSDGVYYEFSAIEPDELMVYSLNDYSGTVFVTPDEIDGHKVTVFLEKALVGNETIETLILSDNIRIIDFDLYNKVGTLKSVFIGAGAEEIMSGMFMNCTNLEQVTVDVRNPYYYSEDNAIIRKKDHCLICSSPGMNEIPSTVSVIGEISFMHSGRKEICIPENIVKIEGGAFSYCNALKTVFIPSSVVEVEDCIFKFSKTEKDAPITVFCESAEKPENWADNWYYVGEYEQGDVNSQEMNDRFVTVHWGASIEEYDDFVRSLTP